MPSSTASAALSEWTFLAEEKCSPLVIPDGCVDFIVKHDTETGRAGTQNTEWLVSDLSERTYAVDFIQGERMSGLRLRPGAIVNMQAISAYTKNHDATDLFKADRFDEFCQIPASVTEALDCLATEQSSINDVAKELAVSTRTLQRKVRKYTGKPPYFWFALARIRRTCRSLHKFDRLTDAAAAFGFADQAHMTREVSRWFGVTPGSINAGSEILDQLQQKGYG